MKNPTEVKVILILKVNKAVNFLEMFYWSTVLVKVFNYFPPQVSRLNLHDIHGSLDWSGNVDNRWSKILVLESSR